MCEEGWTYTQTSDRANLAREGEMIYLSMKGGLWLEEDMPGRSMGPNPEQTLTTELGQIGVEATVFLAAVEGYALAHATKDDSAGGSGHARRSHYPHNPKCRHCMAGRMQHRAKRRKERRVVEGPGEGLKLASDLMGPFEQELMGHLYSIMVVDSDYQWAEVGGLQGKASKGSAEVFEDLVREIARQTNRDRQGAKIA